MMDLNHKLCSYHASIINECGTAGKNYLHGPAKFYFQNDAVIGGDFVYGRMRGDWDFDNGIVINFKSRDGGNVSLIESITQTHKHINAVTGQFSVTFANGAIASIQGTRDMEFRADDGVISWKDRLFMEGTNIKFISTRYSLYPDWWPYTKSPPITASFWK